MLLLTTPLFALFRYCLSENNSPKSEQLFSYEDEGSKKAGVRFGTTEVINYIQVRTLLRASSGCSLILEVRRIDILCKQISDYSTGTAPVILKGHNAGHKHQGALFGDQRALICWSKEWSVTLLWGLRDRQSGPYTRLFLSLNITQELT